MPLVISLIGLLATVAQSLVGRVLLALGMGFVTYKGFDISTAWVLTQIKTNIAGMPADVISFLGYMWVDRAIGMMFAAYTAATVVKFSTSGTLTKLVTK